MIQFEVGKTYRSITNSCEYTLVKKTAQFLIFTDNQGNSIRRKIAGLLSCDLGMAECVYIGNNSYRPKCDVLRAEDIVTATESAPQTATAPETAQATPPEIDVEEWVKQNEQAKIIRLQNARKNADRDPQSGLSFEECLPILNNAFYSDAPRYKDSAGIRAVGKVLMDCKPDDRGKLARYLTPNILWADGDFIDSSTYHKAISTVQNEVSIMIDLMNNGKDISVFRGVYVAWQDNFNRHYHIGKYATPETAQDDSELPNDWDICAYSPDFQPNIAALDDSPGECTQYTTNTTQGILNSELKHNVLTPYMACLLLHFFIFALRVFKTSLHSHILRPYPKDDNNKFIRGFSFPLCEKIFPIPAILPCPKCNSHHMPVLTHSFCYDSISNSLIERIRFSCPVCGYDEVLPVNSEWLSFRSFLHDKRSHTFSDIEDIERLAHAWNSSCIRRNKLHPVGYIDDRFSRNDKRENKKK